MCVRGGVERGGDGDGDGDGADGGVGSEGMEGTARKKSLRRIPAYMVVHLHPDPPLPRHNQCICIRIAACIY